MFNMNNNNLNNLNNLKNLNNLNNLNKQQQRIIKVKWTSEEDLLLSKVVEEHGPHRWDFISSFIPGRNGRQCRERYLSTLSPNVKHSEWTYEEDIVLLNIQQQVGNHWSSISKYLPGRTAIMAKNRFKLLKRRNITFQPTSQTTPILTSETNEDSSYSSDLSSSSSSCYSSESSEVSSPSPLETNQIQQTDFSSLFDNFEDETNLFNCEFDFEF